MISSTQVAVALGSNLEPRLEFLTKAFEALSSDLLQNTISSSVYETAPWGGVATAPFLNAVVVGSTDWKPPAILNFLKQLERDLGRTEAPRYSDREIDLDLIAFGESSWNSQGVIVPHPGLESREFVLVPLAEVWPTWRHPRLNLTTLQLVQLLNRQPGSAIKVAPPLLNTTTP